MQNYKKLSVYHLLEQLTVEAYAAARDLPVDERDLIGTPMLTAVTRSMTRVVHGAMARNNESRLPYIEEAHALSEEVGQHLRMCRRMRLLTQSEVDILTQRQESCTRLLLQWRQTILLAEADRLAAGSNEPWPLAVAEDNGADDYYDDEMDDYLPVQRRKKKR